MVKTALIICVTAAGLGVATVHSLAGIDLQARRSLEPVVEAASASVPVPVVAAVGPSDPKGAKNFKGFKVGEGEQVVPVTGKDFAKGLTATLVAPFGLSTTFPASAIGDHTPTSFTLGVTFDEPGTYLLSVRNRGGAKSNTVQIVVKR